MKRKLLWFCFGVYCAAMLWLLFGQRISGLTFADYTARLQWNLKPLSTIRRFLWVLENSRERGMLLHAVVNLVGNVVMFVPVGVFLPLFWRTQRRLWLFGLTALAVIALVELLQLVTLLGTCDVDDLILNMAGSFVGWLGWRLTTRS